MENPQKSCDAMCKVVVELQEENKKLKEDLKETQDKLTVVENDWIEYETLVSTGHEEYQVDQEFLDEKDEEIEKLKKKNEELLNDIENHPDYEECIKSTIETAQQELKQYALKVHNFAYGTEWDDEDIVSAMDFDGIIEKMKKDEEELIKKAQEQPREDQWPIAYREKNEQIEKLQEENKKLKEKKHDWDHCADGEMIILEREIDKLKEDLIKVPKHSMNYQYMRELEASNQQLRSFQREVDQMEAGLGEIDEDYEDMRYDDLPDVIKKLKKEHDDYVMEKIKQQEELSFVLRGHRSRFTEENLLDCVKELKKNG